MAAPFATNSQATHALLHGHSRLSSLRGSGHSSQQRCSQRSSQSSDSSCLVAWPLAGFLVAELWYTSQQRCFQRSSQPSVSSGWLLKSSVTAEFLAYLATALISAFLTVLWQRILCCIAAHWLPRCGALNALLTALLAALLTAFWQLMPRCLVLTGFLAVRSGGCLPRHRSRFSHGFLAVHASSYDCSRASSLRSS